MNTFNKILFLFALTIFSFNISWGQSEINLLLRPSDSLNIARRNAVVVAESAFYVAGMIQMNKPLTSDHFNAKFHFVSDNVSCLQMDKANHIFVSYQIGNLFSNALQWSGVSKKNQLIYGAGMGFVFLNSIELADGFSKKGASYGDVIANSIGTSLFVSQELLWKEQRIIPKWSCGTSGFVCANPEKTKSQLMGTLDKETIWLSVNLHSFFKASKIPKWMNLAIGYGTEGVDYRPRILGTKQVKFHQYYFSFDADLTKIDTKSHFLKTVFSVVNVVKIPAPTFEINEKGDSKIYFFYF
ncbi:DUF2279 domain-containing protein [Flavobacterium psychrotolerans]|uniref:DUF2279 domain-containing protein n=1 Tax=Flavobacterium psychrotolerans TaxID=2169410 RepID=A0A2U1JGN2_9FLAO|nr:DUF2279 domain-containing protein [Flavobacterium psychrotolerans]PWA04164.1 DUF2279 domain-containing protein [Flavobacterium psychrotolerans]